VNNEAGRAGWRPGVKPEFRLRRSGGRGHPVTVTDESDRLAGVAGEACAQVWGRPASAPGLCSPHCAGGNLHQSAMMPENVHIAPICNGPAVQFSGEHLEILLK
jgi:hypothetical protein